MITKQTVENAIKEYHKIMSTGKNRSFTAEEVAVITENYTYVVDAVMTALMYGYTRGYKRAVKDLESQNK